MSMIFGFSIKKKTALKSAIIYLILKTLQAGVIFKKSFNDKEA